MRIVLDTGIYISFLISPDGYPSRVINLWLDKAYDLVTSEWQLDELRRVSRYEHIQLLLRMRLALSSIN